MEKKVWFGLVLAILLGVYAVIAFGLRPKTIPIIKPSSIESRDAALGYVVSQMREKVEGLEYLALGYDIEDASSKDFAKKLEVALKEGQPKLQIIHLVKADGFHPLESAEVNRLEAKFKVLVPSILIAKVERAGDQFVEPPCVVEEELKKFKDLNCLLAMTTKSWNRSKKIDKTKVIISMEQASSKDFVIYFAEGR